MNTKYGFMVLALAFSAGASVGASFTEFVQNETVGVAGWCSAAEPCAGNLTNLPAAVLSRELCLDEGPQVTCQALGSWIEGGVYSIEDLQCTSVLDSAVLDSFVELPPPLPSVNEYAEANLTMSGLRQACTLTASFAGVVVTIGGMPATFDLDAVAVSFDQTVAGTSTSIDPMSVQFEWLGTATIGVDLPDTFRIPYDTCGIDSALGIDLGLDVEAFSFLEICQPVVGCATSSSLLWSIIIGSFSFGALFDFIEAALEGAFGSELCRQVERLAFDPETSQLGIGFEEFLLELARTLAPAAAPSATPTGAPVVSASPTAAPVVSANPTAAPTSVPTSVPTSAPNSNDGPTQGSGSDNDNIFLGLSGGALGALGGGALLAVCAAALAFAKLRNLHLESQSAQVAHEVKTLDA